MVLMSITIIIVYEHTLNKYNHWGFDWFRCWWYLAEIIFDDLCRWNHDYECANVLIPCLKWTKEPQSVITKVKRSDIRDKASCILVLPIYYMFNINTRLVLVFTYIQQVQCVFLHMTYIRVWWCLLVFCFTTMYGPL